MTTQRLRLGQLLVDAKLISEQALADVLAAQRADGRRLGTLLVERGLINETQLTQILSHQLSVPWVSLLHIEFSRRLLNLVPKDVAERYCLVPIYVRNVRKQGETLYVAMDDPTNEEGLRACSEHSGLPVRAMIAPPQDIRNAIRVYYGGAGGAAQPTAPAAPAAVPSAPVNPPTPPASAPKPSAEVSAFAAPAPSTPRPVLQLVPEPAPNEEEAGPVIEPTPIVQVNGSREPMAAAEAPRPPAPPKPSAPPKRPSKPAPPQAAEAPADPARRSPAEKLRAIFESERPPASPPPPPVSERAPATPPSERTPKEMPTPRGRAPRMVALTLLDGTTITLPARAKRRAPVEEEAVEAPPPAAEGGSTEAMLTARDLVDALRAAAHGADASEVLGPNPRWEAMFAALLSVLLKKHLIADWEFVDEYKKLI